MKKVIKTAICTLLSLLILITASAAAFAVDFNFKDDGSFTILQLTDTQDDQYPARQLEGFLCDAIETAQPDLIIFTGDNVEDFRVGDRFSDSFPGVDGVKIGSGKNTKVNVEKALDAVLSVIDSYDIPFAMVQGNNDYKVNVSNDEWLELFGKYKNNITVDQSEGNDSIDYAININGRDGSAKAKIFCLDTTQDGITKSGLKFFKDESSDGVPAYVFQHIPVAELGRLFTTCSRSDEGSFLYGLKYYKLNDAKGYFEKVYHSSGETEEFAAWKEAGNVKAAFFGHLHTEGYTGTIDGIELNTTFGAEFAKPGPYGMRVITLSEDGISSNTLYQYKNGKFTTELPKFSEKGLFDKLSVIISNLIYYFKYL